MAKQKKIRGLWVRGNSIHFEYALADGSIERGASGFVVGQEEEAAETLALLKADELKKRALLERMVSRGVKDLPKDGDVTIEMYWDAYVSDRALKEKTKKAAQENTWQGREYIKPLVGSMKLTAFKPLPDALEFVEALEAMKDKKGGARLGTRTIRNLFYALHHMFKSAHLNGFVKGNPCVVEKGVLPPPKDKNPDWRRTALYDADEAEQLISSPRVEFRHRVAYALLFWAGLRPQELSALSMADILSGAKWTPLHCLDINKAWDSKYKVVKGVKAPRADQEKPRFVPVHPALAKVLAEWRLSGWAEYMGRPWTPTDLVIPIGIDGHHIANYLVRSWMMEDLDRLQIPRRRAYDTRRTFASACDAADVPRDTIELWLHGDKARVLDRYITVDWKKHCREMAKPPFVLREREVARVSAMGGRQLHSQLHRHTASSSKAMESNGNFPPQKVSPTGFEPVCHTQREATGDNNNPEALDSPPLANHLERREPGEAVQLCSFHWESISDELTGAMSAAVAHDVDGLHARLLRLLGMFEGKGER